MDRGHVPGAARTRALLAGARAPGDVQGPVGRGRVRDVALPCYMRQDDKPLVRLPRPPL